MPAFVTEADVRAYLNVTGTSGEYTTGLVGSNIRAASAFLQRETGRQFENQPNTTKYFTTEGRASIAIPDLRTASAITLQGTALEADTTYYLLPDSRNSGVYTGLQFRSFGTYNYKSNPEWFDRNLDSWWWRQGTYSSLPNDLAITGNWGWSSMPDELLHATKVLAAFYTRRPASVLADVQITPEGNELRFSQLPIEVREFIAQWKLGAMVVAI